MDIEYNFKNRSYLDEKAIIKTTIKKLNKRKSLLKDKIKPDKPKVYKIVNVKKSLTKQNSRSNSRSNSRYNSVQSYEECMYCNNITGITVYKPFYTYNYLENFYYQLENLYYMNYKYLPNQNNLTILFDNFNIYQLIEYIYLYNQQLAPYMFKIIVDIIYLLGIDQNSVDYFFQNSKLIIVRYDKNFDHTKFNNIINRMAQSIIINLGANVNVYDLYFNNSYENPTRLFVKKGSILTINENYNIRHITIPNFFSDPYYHRYEIILYPMRRTYSKPTF